MSTVHKSEWGPKYPDIEVPLTETDGNSMFIVAAVGRALRRAGVSSDEISDFRTDALSGDYDHVLQTTMTWVTVH